MYKGVPPPLGASSIILSYLCNNNNIHNSCESKHEWTSSPAGYCPFPGVATMQGIQIEMQCKPMFGVVGLEDVDKVGEGFWNHTRVHGEWWLMLRDGGGRGSSLSLVKPSLFLCQHHMPWAMRRQPRLNSWTIALSSYTLCSSKL